MPEKYFGRVSWGKSIGDQSHGVNAIIRQLPQHPLRPWGRIRIRPFGSEINAFLKRELRGNSLGRKWSEIGKSRPLGCGSEPMKGCRYEQKHQETNSQQNNRQLCWLTGEWVSRLCRITHN